MLQLSKNLGYPNGKGITWCCSVGELENTHIMSMYSTFQMHTYCEFRVWNGLLRSNMYRRYLTVKENNLVNMDFNKLKLFFFIAILIWQRHGYSASHRHIDENARQPKISPSASKMTGSHNSLAVSASAGLSWERIPARHTPAFWFDLIIHSLLHT